MATAPQSRPSVFANPFGYIVEVEGPDGKRAKFFYTNDLHESGVAFRNQMRVDGAKAEICRACPDKVENKIGFPMLDKGWYNPNLYVSEVLP